MTPRNNTIYQIIVYSYQNNTMQHNNIIHYEIIRNNKRDDIEFSHKIPAAGLKTRRWSLA